MRALPIALLLLLSGVASADLRDLSSPGPLSKVHAELDSRCDACHVPFKGIPDGACLKCHTRTEARIEAGRGTHAAYKKEGKRCVACHKDHEGRDHQLSPPLAEVDKSFTHAKTGFALDGKHASLACGSCHKPGPNGPRWTGLAQTCSGCHKDAHKGALGGECTKCHTPGGWKPPIHDLAQHKVPLDGKHQGLACASCHKNGAHLVATALSCGECHEQKHFVKGTNKSEAPSPGTRACATCHVTEDWKKATFKHDFCTCILPGKHQTASCLGCHPAFKFAPTPLKCEGCHLKERKHDDLGSCAQCHSPLSWKTRAFDHNKPKVGFKIEGSHAGVGCDNCHKTKNVFKGAPTACEGCHATPKHGDFGACATCHAVSGWKDVRFSHDKTSFPIDGKHQGVSCEGCHSKFKQIEYRPGPDACALCHKSPHGEQFAPPQHASLGHIVSAGRACGDCHDTRGWKPSTIDVARHAEFRMPLKGAHQRVACKSCHEGGTLVGVPTDCASCHLGPHRGRLGSDCASCHDESAWMHTKRFDHLQATGTKLEGPHDRKCADCHGQRHEKLINVKTVTCQTCHKPTHGEQFGTRCAECHKVTRFSDVPRFDHTGKTGFALERRHAALACTTCHDARRGARLQPACRTCHEDIHRGRTLLECGECHRPDRWTLVRFDHNRTEFPINGRHFLASCRSCHANDQYTGLRMECVACHRADRQRADQTITGHSAFAVSCNDCHSPFKW